MVSDKKIFSLYKPAELGHFGPMGHNLNKLGICLLHVVDATYQICLTFGFRQEDFFMFPYISICKTSDPRFGPFLAPGA